jgi:transposase
MRAALYMPTLSAVRHDPGARAHYQALLLAGKSPMQANVAVMRKLLHGIYGMFRHGASYRPDKLFSRTPVLSAHPAGDTSVPTSLRLSPA